MIRITIMDTLESSSSNSSHSDNEANPLTEDTDDTLTEDAEELFLYGYFDNLFQEDAAEGSVGEHQSTVNEQIDNKEEQEEEERPRKMRRIIQCEETAKKEVLNSLQYYTETEDIVEFKEENEPTVCIFVDLTEEECLLMDLVSAHPSITMNDLGYAE